MGQLRIGDSCDSAIAADDRGSAMIQLRLGDRAIHYSAPGVPFPSYWAFVVWNMYAGPTLLLAEMKDEASV